ncbi:MAG TPA: hypothetical protein VFA96_01455, partial [Nocardioides sp.]|nr:hypothetical protein [Nocardioides sp.]
ILARLLLVVWVPPEAEPVALDIPELEARLAQATPSWGEELRDALTGHAGEERGSPLYLPGSVLPGGLLGPLRGPRYRTDGTAL